MADRESAKIGPTANREFDGQFQAGRTALLVVDMQRAWIEPGLCWQHSDSLDDDRYFYRETGQRVIPNIRKLLATARRKGVEVVHTVIQSMTADGRDCSREHQLAPIYLAPGYEAARPIAEVAPANDELVLARTAWCVFGSTNLHYLLRNMGMRCLLVVGIMTDQSVRLVAREGFELGYRVTCLSDACAAGSKDRHGRALSSLTRCATIEDTDSVLAALRALPPTPRALV
jgi:nicotinamidase-related amidase